MEIIKTNSDNKDFIQLVHDLDIYLAAVDGDEHAFYAQFNKTSTLQYVIVAYENRIALGCGAIREIDGDTMEIKRMYTVPASRGKGIASRILMALEIWTEELGYKKCVLETSRLQTDAIALYKKQGYTEIPNYGQYAGMGMSICFEKVL